VPFILTQPPIVSTFTPTSGAPGTEVTIRGSGFGTVLNLVEVRMGNHRLQVRSVANSEIVAVVPAAATSEQITVAVRLQGTGSSQARFAVATAFRVNALTPASTFIGDTLLIAGEGFVTGAVVRFVGVRRPVQTEVTDAGLAVVVPPRARTGALRVVLPDGRSVETPPFTVVDPPAGIAITQLSPACYRAGCHVVIRGHGFGATARLNVVTFGDRPARVSYASPGRLIVQLPAAPGTNRFKVAVPRVGEALSEPFTIVP
jgi:hypothetical protein